MTGTDKILLVLDLDETLIHASDERLERAEDFRLFDYFVYVRPHVERFLLECAAHFRLAVWSSASDDYAAQVVKKIFPPELRLEFIWGRSRCTFSLDHQLVQMAGYLDPSNHYNYVKKLHKLKRKGYRLERVLIVDDTPQKCGHNYGNAIYVSEYKGAEHDDELLHLSRYLATLADAINVRVLEKRHWRSAFRAR
ncbi:HAD family hydrolase [Archangium violaceum]|uniref:NIF family HAD-type phosphatase n=1 Tax=Archangium violaceum TaxID=83451 RepID=UPI0019508EFB|nr:HAD family hydrolase [Archangium violaceum]QRN98024.1 HAD family hydrolase [Archangium violaceum]